MKNTNGERSFISCDLESLIAPEVDAIESADKLILNLPKLREATNLSEQRKILLTTLEAVYVDQRSDRYSRLLLSVNGLLLKYKDGFGENSSNPSLFLEVEMSQTPVC
jgi:hypothetical protein